MKKTDRTLKADVRAEYDFNSMKGAVRGKYVKRLRQQSNIVVLEPDVAEAFPSDMAVNRALRGILSAARAVRRTGSLDNKASLSPAPKRRKKA